MGVSPTESKRIAPNVTMETVLTCTMVANLANPAEARLPDKMPKVVKTEMLRALRTINWRIKMSAQFIWRESVPSINVPRCCAAAF